MITIIDVIVVYYWCNQGDCVGTNVLYEYEGKRKSARFPYTMRYPGQAKADLEAIIRRQIVS